MQGKLLNDDKLLYSVYLQPNLNGVIRKDRTKLDFVKFLHAAAFGPTNKTWTKAVNNNYYTTWPGLTSNFISKHLPLSISTACGHMKQEFKATNPQSKLKTKMTSFLLPMCPLKNKSGYICNV